MSRLLTGIISAISLFLPSCQLTPSAQSSAGDHPPRAIELDRLGIFVGRWEESGETLVGEKTSKFAGTSTINWEADQRAIVARSEISDPETGRTTQEFSVWTWDDNSRRYQTFRLSGAGETGHGTATYDEAANTWRLAGKDRNASTSRATLSEGTVRFSDNHTMHWSMTMWNAWKTQKLAESRGTNRRLP